MIVNHVTLTSGQIRWNGVAVSEQTLVQYLRETRDSAPVPFVVLDPQTADCAQVQHMKQLLEQNYSCRQGSCGLGSAAAFVPA